MRGVEGRTKNGKYKSRIVGEGKKKVFPTELEAHQHWQNQYADYIESKVAQYATEKWFNSYVADALLARAWKLRLNALLGIPTTVI